MPTKPKSVESPDIASLFPGRKVLRVSEAATALAIPQSRVCDLIEEGKLGALDMAGSGKRKLWRIPVTELQKFLEKPVPFRRGSQ